MKAIQPAASTEDLNRCIARAMEEKQGQDMRILDLRQLRHSVVDYFVLCTANNEPHMDALVAHIETEVRRQCNQRPWFVEGKPHDQWILLDYVDVVAHVFMAESRTHYALEELWGDAKEHLLDSKKTNPTTFKAYTQN